MSLDSIITYEDCGMEGTTIHDNCGCQACQEDIPIDYEVTCQDCIGKLSEEKKTCCSTYRLTLSCPSGKCYFVCSKCMAIKPFVSNTDSSERKPLPIICPCKKVDDYFMIERIDRIKAVCKVCQKSAIVKYSKKHDCYELWSEGRCPLCLATPVRISSSLTSTESDMYECDDCSTSFSVSPEIQRSFASCENQGGTSVRPNCVTLLDDCKLLRPGDLIQLEDNGSPVLFIEESNGEGFFYANNNGNECSRKKKDDPEEDPDSFRRFEFLPHNRRPPSQVVEDAMELIKEGKGSVMHLPVYVKTGYDKPLDLSAIPVRDYRIAKKCPKCGAPFTRSTLEEFKDYSICLFCASCRNSYQVPDVPEQRSLLTNSRKSVEIKFETIDDLGVSDVIKILRLNLYSHYAICTKVDHKNKKVTLVELTFKTEPASVGIFENKMDFSEIYGSLVLRFHPLDCLSAQRVIKRAQNLVKHHEDQPNYQFFTFNCQHFAMWCKTNRMCSEDGKYYENLYGYVYTGVNLAALLLPVLRPLSCSIIALDALLKAFHSKYSPSKENDISLPPIGAPAELRALQDFLMELSVHRSL